MESCQRHVYGWRLGQGQVLPSVEADEQGESGATEGGEEKNLRPMEEVGCCEHELCSSFAHAPQNGSRPRELECDGRGTEPRVGTHEGGGERIERTKSMARECLTKKNKIAMYKVYCQNGLEYHYVGEFSTEENAIEFCKNQIDHCVVAEYKGFDDSQIIYDNRG